MVGVLSDIVQYRARSVISRYLHQRAEPKATQPPVNSSGVQQRQSDDNDISVSDSSDRVCCSRTCGLRKNTSLYRR